LLDQLPGKAFFILIKEKFNKMVPYFATDRSREIAEKLQKYLKDEIMPLEKEWFSLPFKEVEAIIRKKKPAIEEIGAWNLYLDRSLGGPELTLMEIAQIGEVMGTSPFGHFLCNSQAPDAGNIELLKAYGSEEIIEKYLYPLTRGEIRSCFGMTEPALAGSNPVRMDTIAIEDGEYFIINGRKWFTTGADGAAFCIVMAITDPENDNPYQRASMIIVPTECNGFNIERNISVMGHPGEGNMSHAEITLTDVRVPKKYLLGANGDGFKLAQERLGPGRIHHCMRWIGISARCFDMMCKRAATRELSVGVTLGQKQMVQSMIAESKAEIDAARLMVLNAAYIMENHGQRAARKEISAIKFFTSDILCKVIDRAIQVHGALGVTDDTILSWYYREERGSRIYDGTDETHKASLARQILKRYLT
jgi:alkylation response protein AidB-like acyl-CoA dehydrogenase